MKISVIIPTYNRKHTLNRAIHSVLSQTSQPREIIAVDDGSTDGTKKWLAKMYPAIRYVYQSKSGVSAARNVGIKTAQGDW
ncbi:MAG TPA: glycosyltransferase family 2 protein, partial [Candidatus Marinimicrobia bacterium]|nr:glycosyltransferase family 2 protein [Candidatus Neomarinimicrobiota bacterium]